VKGSIELKPGTKDFFTTFFSSTKDWEEIFERGPYFYNSLDLRMRYWTGKFDPKKEGFSKSPIWIRMYSLQLELG
jgi:hypothetical protein